MELSDEQVEFLAEFMGWSIPSDPILADHQRQLFYLAETREAVMDRAVEKGYVGIDFFYHKADKKWEASVYKLPELNETASYGPNQFIAFLNALILAEAEI